MSPIRVLIVDDHALLRDGLRALLASADDITIVGEADDGLGAISRCQALDPDVMLLDISMPNLGGLEALLEVRRTQPRTKVVMLTQYDDREYVRRFLHAGASGYVLKSIGAADLVSAIRAVAKGGLFLDPLVARDALAEAREVKEGAATAGNPYDSLTDREKQVLRLVAEGHSNKSIADTLGISVKTAMTHREHVMDKLGLHNRTDLIKFALRHDVIRLGP
jgi:two-component system, NarL family, response regulator NreC